MLEMLMSGRESEREGDGQKEIKRRGGGLRGRERKRDRKREKEDICG